MLTWSGYALHPTIHPNAALVRWRQNQAKSPPYLLDPPRRQRILDTILAHCSKRNWLPLALHVRATHIHLILETTDDPSRVIGELKSACTKTLRAANLAGPRDRIWADNRNIRNLNTPESLTRAIDYVLNGQGPPMQIFPFPNHRPSLPGKGNEEPNHPGRRNPPA